MKFSCPRTVTVHSYVLYVALFMRANMLLATTIYLVVLGCRKGVSFVCRPYLRTDSSLVPLRLGVEMCLRFRFKIRLIIAFVLCLVGGIGEISSQFESFLCQMLCILAVFERQNKCSPVATTSTPKYSSPAPRFSRAVTIEVVLRFILLSIFITNAFIYNASNI